MFGRFLGHHARRGEVSSRRYRQSPVKPVHPMLVHFPIALLALSVTTDLIAFFSHSASLRNAGWWALVGAAVGAVVTVPAGLFDMRRADLDEEVHVRVHRHMKVGFALLAAILGLTFWRWRTYVRPGLPVTATYLDVALLTLALAAFQGWLGGELVFSDGVSVRRSRETGSGDSKQASHHH